MLKFVIPLIIFLLFENSSAQQNSRRPSPRDHILCNHKLFKDLEKIRESIDPNCRAEAYWNRTGLLCTTYCRIQSRNREVKQKQLNVIHMFGSPVYEVCGQERYCNINGSCKRLELFENNSKEEVTETTATTTTTNTTATIAPSSIRNTVTITTTTAPVVNNTPPQQRKPSPKNTAPDEAED